MHSREQNIVTNISILCNNVYLFVLFSFCVCLLPCERLNGQSMVHFSALLWKVRRPRAMAHATCSTVGLETTLLVHVMDVGRLL